MVILVQQSVQNVGQTRHVMKAEKNIYQSFAHIVAQRWTGRKKTVTKAEILQKAIDTYGQTMQEDVCIEEMSELAKAIIKMRRDSKLKHFDVIKDVREENICEEIADVQIMLDQMRIIYGDTSKIEQYKLDRLAKRLERGA
jgi:DNA-binding transcriptional regulator GbsR (MarR family)